MIRRLVALVLLVVTVRAEESKSGNDPKKPAAETQSESSRMVLELQLRTLYDEQAKKKAQADRLEEFAKAVTAARTKLETSTVPDATGPLQSVRTAATSLKAAWQPNNAAGASQGVLAFIGALDRATYEISRGANEALMELSAIANPNRGPDAPVVAKLPDNVTRAFSDAYGKFGSDWTQRWQTKLPKISELFRAVYAVRYNSPQEFRLPDNQLPGAVNALPVAEALDEVDRKLDSELGSIGQTYLTERVAALKSLENTIADEKKLLKDDLEKLDKQVVDLDHKLKTREDTQAGLASTVSGNLQPIFWGMMSAIVLTIALLRYRADAQALLMIRERTAVEMLSIGMFLVTVLFLGAGGFIEKATLGTLLGTLAGYLFTRRPSPSAQDGTHPTPVPAPGSTAPTIPATPAAPVYVAATKSVTIPPAASTEHFTLVARDVAAGTDLALGQVPAGAFNLAAAPGLTAGKTYDLRLTLHGPGGASAPSQPTTIQL